MPKNTDLYFEDFRRVDADERELIYRLSDLQLTLPGVNIFDSPTRCFQLNEEWCKIVLGAVSLLLEVDAWKDAVDENYSGIQQILLFLEGAECMDCNAVEACLATSQIIADMIADIATNTNNIATNTNNIATNTNNIATNTNNIAINTGDISDLETRVTNLEVDASQKTLTLNDHETRITNLEVDASQKTLTLNDHEIRITDLEAAVSGGGGGGGGSNVKITAYSNVLDALQDISSGTWTDLTKSVFTHTFTYSKALIVYEVKALGLASTAAGQIRIVCGGLTGLFTTYTRGTDRQSIQIAEVFEGTGGTPDIKIQAINTGTTIRFEKDSTISMFIIEYTDALPAIYEVTFAAGGWPFSIDESGAPFGGSVAAGGNPDPAVVFNNPGVGETIAVNVDMSQDRQIDDITFEVYSANIAGTKAMLFIDTIFINQITLSGANNTWEAFSFPAGWFPDNGQVVRIQIVNDSGGPITEMRLDNIKIYAS